MREGLQSYIDMKRGDLQHQILAAYQNAFDFLLLHVLKQDHGQVRDLKIINDEYNSEGEMNL